MSRLRVASIYFKSIGILEVVFIAIGVLLLLFRPQSFGGPGFSTHLVISLLINLAYGIALILGGALLGRRQKAGALLVFAALLGPVITTGTIAPYSFIHLGVGLLGMLLLLLSAGDLKGTA